MKNISKLPDEDLVALYAAGCNQAFDILLKRHEPKVFGYILSYVGNREVANDLFQETFFKAIITIKNGNYNETGKFSAWILRIARNIVIDHFRVTKSENSVSADSSPVDIFNRKELSEGTIEDMLTSQQLQEDVRSLVESLPSNQREVLKMRYYSDMPFKEIAEETKVSVNTALGRMRYALINLRRIAESRRISLTV
ncbi:MAG: sigma-70 family RNA polymerase sigma factor [Paramuribaculum sp.]|nr:sigma-70 family RNA polymerase sigma factor [Paramuribaculum sp.]